VILEALVVRFHEFFFIVPIDACGARTEIGALLVFEGGVDKVGLMRRLFFFICEEGGLIC